MDENVKVNYTPNQPVKYIGWNGAQHTGKFLHQQENELCAIQPDDGVGVVYILPKNIEPA